VKGKQHKGQHLKNPAKTRSAEERLSISKEATSERQLAFVRAYLIKPNATEAALKAGYSKKSAGSIGCQLLNMPKIKALIDQARARLAEKDEITAAWVKKEMLRQYRELGELNRYDLSELYDAEGCLKPMTEWPAKLRTKSALKVLKTREIYEYNKKTQQKEWVGYMREVAFTDHKHEELNALRQIGEHVSVRAFDPKTEVHNANIEFNVVYVNSNKEQQMQQRKVNGHDTEPIELKVANGRD